ncbi:MAG: aldo/keto reductase [Devosia sp.]|nr:aldo/keto reductase [Devosia sp.]
MDPFEQRPLGRTKVMLPRLGLGGAPFGNLFVPISDTEVEATMAAAWDLGIRYYDTSPWYGRGLSERRMGSYLLRQPRQELRLSTKVGRVFRAPPDAAALPPAAAPGPRGCSSSITTTTATPG